MTSSEIFGTIRSILQQPPSTTSFGELITLLTTHASDEALHEVWLPYVTEGLRDWPDQYCEQNVSCDRFHRAQIDELLVDEGISRLVRQLSCGYMEATPLHDLVHHPWLAHVKGLKLSDSTERPENIRAAFEGGPLKHLRTINLRNVHHLKEEGAKVLAECLDQPALEELDLSNCGLGAKGIKPLLANPHILKLRRLDLTMNPLGAGSVKAMEKATGLNQLEHLNLYALTKGKVKAAGAQAIARSTHLGSLTYLGLRDQHIEDEGLRAIIEAPQFTQLSYLDLTYNRITGASVSALCESPNSSALRRLALPRHHDAGDDIARAIASSSVLSSLTHLDLSQTSLTDDGFLALLDSPVAQQLIVLVVYRNELTERSALAIKNANLPKLKALNLYNEGIDRAHTDELKARYKVPGMVL